MKKVLYILALYMTSSNCQDVVSIDAPNEEPRLIFDAILPFNADTPRENRIHVSTTGNFFDEIEPTLIERIQLLNTDVGGVAFYAPDPNILGDYIPGEDDVAYNPPQLLIGEPNPEHTNVLTFVYNEELYLAFSSYTSVPELTSVTQGTETLFDENETEIIISFTDPEDEENFYAFSFGDGEYVAIEDTFFNGQDYTFSYFTDQNLNPGYNLEVKMWGVDEQLYNYIGEIITQSEFDENPLFQTPVTTVRGNILKVEDIDNIDLFDNVGRPQEFVLGYFAMIQERSQILTIQ